MSENNDPIFDVYDAHEANDLNENEQNPDDPVKTRLHSTVPWLHCAHILAL
jgi:hypothetical protein